MYRGIGRIASMPQAGAYVTQFTTSGWKQVSARQAQPRAQPRAPSRAALVARLWLACLLGEPEAVRRLLGEGADPLAEDARGRSAMEFALGGFGPDADRARVVDLLQRAMLPARL